MLGRRLILIVASIALFGRIGSAQPIENWTAPPYWSAASHGDGARPSHRSSIQAEGMSAADAVATPLPFVALTPCRLADTRGNGFSGDYGPPSISQGLGSPRDFLLSGHCGIPATAQAVSLNLTVTNTQGAGYILIYPSDAEQPLASTLNYSSPGVTLANAAIVPVSASGSIAVAAGVSGTDLVIDVNGYYDANGVVNDVNGISGSVTLSAGSNITITPSGNTLTVDATGLQGSQGPTGPQGPAGADGAAGSTGPQGPIGSQGPIGPQGADGAVGPQGPTGPAGLIFKNAWDSSTTYNTHDAVSSGGSSYVSLIDDNVGNDPAVSNSQWQILAAQGAAGPDGQQGVQGSEGPQGPAGSQGPTGPQGPGGPQGPQGLTGPIGGSPIVGGTSGNTNMLDNSYVGMFATNLNTTEIRVQNIIPANGTLKNFFVFIETPPGTGDSWTFVVRKNAVSTAVTCTVSGNSALSCSDLAHSATFVPGDLISIRIDSTGSPSNGRMQWTALFGP